MSTTLEHRLNKIIADLEGDTYGRWKRLEMSTGVSGTRWKNVSQGAQRPAPDMIEAIAQLAPQYAFWLATGITDPQHGHVAPDGEGYPSTGHEQTNSTRYFKELIAEKKLATATCLNWFKAEDFPVEESDVFSDSMILGVESILRIGDNEHSIDQTEFKAQQNKRLLAAKLRDAEITMYGDMPNFDFDEMEPVLKAIDRLIGELTNAKVEMPEGTKIVTDKLSSLMARVQRHKNHPLTLERFEKMRQLKDKQQQKKPVKD
jgi:hypothetical protein